MAQPCGACGETKWARGQLSGRVERDLHVTVCRRSDGRMRLELCKECKLYHCPFCQPAVYKPKGDYASVWTHVEIHRMRALQHGEFNIHSCHLQCRGERHFHCPYCAKTIITRKQFESHMDKCVETQSSTTAATGIQSAAPPGSPALPVTTVGQCAVLLLNLTPPFQQPITMGPFPTAPKPPAQPKSTADQHPALPELPVEPKPSADQHPSPPDPPVKSNCTSGQSSASPDLLVEPTTTAGQPAAAPPDPSVQLTAPAVHASTLTDDPVKQTSQIDRTVRRKIKCPMCNLYLNKKNLRKHKLRKHLISEKDITAKDHLRSQCIDSHNGVYAVAKSYKATAVPVHVIKKKSGSTHKMVCEEDRCEVISDFQRRSGLPNSQCPHLRSVDFCFTRACIEDLKPGVLEELVDNKWIGKDMGAKCLNHRDQATQSRAPLVTLVDLGGSHCLYLSVFEPKVSQYSKLGRLFVTYNVKGRLWHCDCSRGRISCLHKCIAKWFLFQTNKELFSPGAKRDSPLSISDVMEDSPAETSTENSPGTVCPLREDRLKEMAKYIYNQKKLPTTFPENITQFESEMYFSKYFIPVETVCQECPGHVSLTEPVLITNKARVITLTGMTEDNSTFFKKCPDCEMVYCYQEWSEGLHNFNNDIILSLQLCILLQNSIKSHTNDGGVVEVLRTVGVKSPCGMEVLQAYIHFEALTSHDCPSEVMMDLYQKGIFNMAGIEIKGLPESFTGEVNAEEFWDSVCMEIITSSLVARSSAYVATSDGNNKEAAVSAAVTTSFMPAEIQRLSKQRTEECHRAVSRYLVKGLHPLSTVESPWFREMTKTLNPRYHLPSRDQLINTLIPSWYAAEKKHVIRELLQVSKAAVTCDWWTSFAHDHYLTVTLHFIMKGQMRQKVLCTKSVCDTQTDTVVAEQIGGVLEEFGVLDKVVAMTVDNVFRIAIKKLQLRKLRCFAHILNLAAQKVYTSNTVARWASKIRAVVVWIKRFSTAQTVLQEKQQLLNLPQHSLVLDVQTHWSSLYLMVERFVEQYAALQATTTDPQIKPYVEKKRLETLTDDDHRKAEEFIRIMKPLYTSSLCVSADKSPTCSQIFPILKKLEAHFETRDEDSLFTATLKEKVWGDLSTCYKDGDTWKFLQESSALDPRFKKRIDSDEIWYRVENAAVRVKTKTQVSNQEEHRLLQEDDSDASDVSEQKDKEPEYSSDETPYPKRPRLTALEELFEEEDRVLKSSAAAEKTLSIPERVQQEIQLYRNLPAVPTSEDALAWWWERRDTLPLLSELSNSYLCIQASSTPRERVFSTAGDTLSHERSHVLPEQADMQIFLQKNC
ncbi:uncharacterized protein LOC123986603 isoform X1 [Micropterus dolomieu]|uniref:uncharacterized protein LOC123986603 isoform X1 n=1 Tax=Micropterus dolomieu TaxID=147949 RepID=UPI001E8E3E88|nr:uncharacterized protein LOC123986603 isoform X1 [Micropterus dolomieu]